MGEVYRARDTKLNRDVALKVLLDAFTQDPDRLARFKREAQVLASLNHPNIAAIYGFEESDGVQALVLELVEGPMLADRIAQASGGPKGPPLRTEPGTEPRSEARTEPRSEARTEPRSEPRSEPGMKRRGGSSDPPISSGRDAHDREADRRRARGGARAGHHPRRPEACQYQGPSRRRGEGARLRAGEAHACLRARASGPRRDGVAHWFEELKARVPIN